MYDDRQKKRGVTYKIILKLQKWVKDILIFLTPINFALHHNINEESFPFLCVFKFLTSSGLNFFKK